MFVFFLKTGLKKTKCETTKVLELVGGDHILVDSICFRQSARRIIKQRMEHPFSVEELIDFVA